MLVSVGQVSKFHFAEFLGNRISFRSTSLYKRDRVIVKLQRFLVLLFVLQVKVLLAAVVSSSVHSVT